MTVPRLTDAQWRALEKMAVRRVNVDPSQPLPSEMIARGDTVNVLENRGLVKWTHYHHAHHYLLTDAGRAALQARQEGK